MRIYFFRFMLAAALYAGVVPAVPADDNNFISEILVTREDEESGKSIFTVRMLVDKSTTLDRIDYEIIYHQDFPFEDSRGNKYHKVNEPVVFKYSAKNVKMTADIDSYVNFRVPVNRERLKIIYGNRTFHPDYPITIPRIKITGYIGKKQVFTCTVGVGENFIWDAKGKKFISSGKKSSAAKN